MRILKGRERGREGEPREEGRERAVHLDTRRQEKHLPLEYTKTEDSRDVVDGRRHGILAASAVLLCMTRFVSQLEAQGGEFTSQRALVDEGPIDLVGSVHTGRVTR